MLIIEKDIVVPDYGLTDELDDTSITTEKDY